MNQEVNRNIALPAYFKSYGTVVTDSRDIANMFNTYFGTNAEDMNQSILNHQSLHKQNEFSKFLLSAVESTLFVEETTLTLSLRQAGAVSKKIFDCFFLVYWVHLNDIYQILGGWFTRWLETSMFYFISYMIQPY